MNIYVGNLSYQATEESLRELFARHGFVDNAKIIKDRESGESRGFAFVEMPAIDEARAAIEALNGQDFLGRTIVVNEARPRKPQHDRGGRRGGGGRGGDFRKF